MKKFLVATTALVAVASVAQAADPIKLQLGGYMNQYAGYTSQDKDGQTAYAKVKVVSETEIYFRGSTKLDNGLTVGVNIDRYSDRDDTTGDDVFMSVSSDSLGMLKIGQTKGAAYGLSHGAPDVALGNNDGDVEDWIFEPTAGFSVTADQTQTASESNDGSKLVYLTPNFGGFQAGVSWGLNANNTGIESPVDIGGTNTGADTAADAAIAYNGDFGGVKVGADLGYQRDFNGGTTGTTVQDRKATRVGASVGVAGFTVGGAYRWTKNEGNVKDVDAEGWNVGASYATGPYGVSLSYLNMQQDEAANVTRQDERSSWVLGGSYDLGAGVKFVGSVFQIEYDDASATASNSVNDNEGYGVVAGLRVNF